MFLLRLITNSDYYLLHFLNEIFKLFSFWNRSISFVFENLTSIYSFDEGLSICDFYMPVIIEFLRIENPLFIPPFGKLKSYAYFVAGNNCKFELQQVIFI